MCKGWFHHPNTHWLVVHLWQNDTGWKGGDRPAGGDRSRSVRGWPGRSVLFAGPLLRAHLLTTGRRVVVWPAAIVRPPGGTGPGRLRHQLSPASIYSRRQRRLVHRTQPRRSPGAWWASAANKRHRAYTCALLATTTSAYKWGLKVASIGGILDSWQIDKSEFKEDRQCLFW